MKRVRHIFRRLLRRARAERELDAEVSAYFDGHADEMAAGGMPRKEAQRRVAIEAGGREQVKEAVRDARSGVLFEQTVQDFRYALRGLRRAPGFAAVAILTLALGIGVSTALFSVADTVLLRPLPYADAQQLAMIYEGESGQAVLSMMEINRYVQARTVEAVAAMQPMNVTVLGGEQPEQVTGALVSATLFPMLRVKPLMGRVFLAEEDRPGAGQVALISEALWRRRFDADPDIAGKAASFEVNEMWGLAPKRQQAFTIVGVLPATFRTLLRGTEGDVWFPLATAETDNHDLFVAARMKRGVQAAQVKEELESLTESLRTKVHSDGRPVRLQVIPLLDDLLGNWRGALTVLVGAVGFVVLIAGVNLGNLLALRDHGRRREMAVRSALGADRGRLVRQTMMENAVLACVGGALGLLVAYGAIQWLASASPAGISRMDEVRLDMRVAAFALGFTALAGLVSGLLATRRVSTGAAQESLRESGRGLSESQRGSRMRAAFVVAQIAMALVLLIGSGLMVRSLLGLLRVETGFNAKNLLTMRISLPRHKYGSGQRRAPFYEALFARVRAMPGVQSIAVDQAMPFGGLSMGARISRVPGGPGVDARWRMVSEDYFRTLGIPMLKGREFEPAELRGTAAPAVLSQSLAEQLFGQEDPVGRQIHLSDNPPFTVVGVAANARNDTQGEHSRNIYFGVYPRAGGLLMRATADHSALTTAVRKALADLESSLAPSDVRSMEQRVAAGFAVQRYTALLLSLFAGAALFIGAVGLYGVVSYGVNRRTNEIGVRIAMGATRGAVMRLVLRQGLALVLAGVVIGLGAAYGLTRFLASLLFGVKADDPGTFALYAVSLGAVGLLATYVPARRAARVDPLVALRHE